MFHHQKGLRWLVLLMALGFAVPAQAQYAPPVLVVTVRNTTGTGIAGVSITVHDRGGTVAFARAVTDINGTAVIETLPTQEVRIAVSGQLPDGSVLKQLGQDTQGIAMTLLLPPNQLDLRVAADGTVIPDPATMLALETGPIPIEPPHAAVATAVIAPTTSRPVWVSVQTAPVEAVAPPDTRPAPRDWGIVLALLALPVVGFGLWMLALRYRHQRRRPEEQ